MGREVGERRVDLVKEGSTMIAPPTIASNPSDIDLRLFASPRRRGGSFRGY